MTGVLSMFGLQVKLRMTSVTVAVPFAAVLGQLPDRPAAVSIFSQFRQWPAAVRARDRLPQPQILTVAIMPGAVIA